MARADYERTALMEFRKLNAGRQLAGWVKDLTGKSGVYLIRQDGELLYVGESHTGNLKRTLLRHFQHWKGPTAGPTFPKSLVEIAIVKTRPERAVETQNALIEEHRPRLNVEGKPASWLDKLIDYVTS